MRKIITLLFWLFIFLNGFSQPMIRKDTLSALDSPVRFVAKYVNFDVLKIMIGHGFLSTNRAEKGFSFSFDAQFLFPKPLFKNNKTFHIAYGISFGRDASKIKKAQYNFAGNNALTSIAENHDIKRIVQKVGYAGLVLMPFFDFKNFHVMTGISARINTVTKLKTYFTKNRAFIDDAKKLHPITFPLLLQLSYSPQQLFSYGIYGTYDLTRRFKGSTINTRQIVVGVTAGIRI